MSNSKVRCNICRNYFAADSMYRTGLGGFGGVCSEECWEAFLEKYKAKRTRRKMHREMRYTTPGRIPGSVRDRVRRRDDDKCQWCGAITDLQIHHVRYRSEGGPDVQYNLITLCEAHHSLAHDSKEKYQHILLLWLWCQYNVLHEMATEVKITVPAAFRLAREHPEWVDRARAYSNEIMARKKDLERVAASE